MKFRGPVFFSILLITFLVASFFYPKVDNGDKESVLMQIVLGNLTQLHYKPQKIDDNFSQKLFDLYIDRLDWGKRYLTQEDLAKLEMYKYDLDNEALNGNYEFFNLTNELLVAGLNKTQAYYREILAEPFDFSKEEDIEFDPDKKGFEKDDAALEDYWRRYLKYQTLTRLSDKFDEQEQAGEEEKRSFEDLEKEAREDVLETLDRNYNFYLKVKRPERLSAYLSSVAQIFDPHSDYMAPVERENFNMSMYGKLEGIGAQLTQDGEYVKIHSIVVGGPAWKGKELEENDLILKVGQGDEEPVDIVGWSTTEAVQLIRGKKGTEVRLTVRKVDGSVKQISIIRDVIIFEEGFAKSLIMNGENENERIGYISLPGFYADFDDQENGRFSSKDVATEIEKLKAENVDGIILDLRDNGGGSLVEAINLSGLFIDKGPIVQVKSPRRDAIVYEDEDPSIQYDGPLAIMVNQNSASASEILAGAMQDYGRAVIVGSKSTFGKGTVQSLMSLDRYARGYDEYKPLGDLKLTFQKFYRIDGGSNQLKGVIPDIVLPDVYSHIETGEKDQLYALEWSEIEPAKEYRFKGPLSAERIDVLRQNSEQRVQSSETFQKIEENARWIKTQRDLTNYPLELEAYRTFESKRNKQSEQYRKMFDKDLITGLRNLEVDLPSLDTDEGKKARNEAWLKSSVKDIHLYETIQIMHDLITLQ